MRRFLIHLVCLACAVGISILVIIYIPKDLKPLGFMFSVALGMIAKMLASYLSDIYE